MTDRPVEDTSPAAPAGEPHQGPPPAGEPSEGPPPAAAGSEGFGESAGEVGDESLDAAPAPAPASAQAPASAPAPGELQDDEAGVTGAADEDTEVDELAAMKSSLVDLTNDLQRLSAEYANYRKRVDRDRQLVAENAAYNALTPVIEVLDTIDRAREHAELDGGFKAVADQLERAVASSGLSRFGTPGDAFDPTIHEALSHIGEDPDVSVTTAKIVAKSGYKINDRVVRAAQVLVVDPAGSE